MLCGFLFGFPIGSKLASDLYREGLLSRRRAQLLCACTNNMSPAFVVSYVLNAQLHMPDRTKGTFVLLYGIPLLCCLIGLWMLGDSESREQKKRASRFHMSMQIVDAGILNSFETLIRLCGYIVMFSIMARMVIDWAFPFASAKLVVIGTLEVTNGISYLAASAVTAPVTYVCAIAFLSFGGISGIAQTGSVIAGTDLKLGTYIRDKCLITLLCMAGAILCELCGVG